LFNANKYFQFEIDIKKFFEKQKFEVVHWSANRRNDGGKDVIATTKKGDEIVAKLIQCKCYAPKHKIGPNLVRELAGSMLEYGDKCDGIIITTSDFTEDAEKLRIKYKNENNYNIEFINGKQLLDLINI
jgi:HJR/Mrr/RecB family endonuclease|tara:strand:+ start:36 stop:422 length:387 start_codon:yes stop_codon:yes gene_type:complete